ncbi:hypothetical protein AXG93_4139s1060 [Marchantia polymorpha subsp. ruderalis]|uniref:Uncharacterized protein n=1 Tax=Marchantia polymorpha subsp. ruderalis TaxID=1480154 RepID=A0A176VR54_MARPO|nr:hypothetical protein AXG93_4139s1060 [Marchantia polymorpha subsp. ruderalis]
MGVEPISAGVEYSTRSAESIEMDEKKSGQWSRETVQYTIQYEGLSTILLVDAGYVRDVVRGSEIIDQDGVSGPRAWIYPMYGSPGAPSGLACRAARPRPEQLTTDDARNKSELAQGSPRLQREQALRDRSTRRRTKKNQAALYKIRDENSSRGGSRCSEPGQLRRERLGASENERGRGSLAFGAERAERHISSRESSGRAHGLKEVDQIAD